VPVLNVTPEGRAPLSLSVGVGKPVAVTVKAPAVPTVNVVRLALVMVGAVGVVFKPVPERLTVGVPPLV
jgi:hypothetical protein